MAGVKSNFTALPPLRGSFPSLLRKEMRYHARTLWLFTRSDLKTVFFPQMLLATANAFSGQFVDGGLARRDQYFQTIFARLPMAAFWIWIHLLFGVIANQRLPQSIEEDSKNKPWRPLPSQRLLPGTATDILVCLVPAALCISYLLGETAFLASALFGVFIWLYNDLRGSSSGPFIRNVLNACGLLSFSVGATAIATGESRFPVKGWIWFGLLWWIILTTIQTQDLPDIEGDKAIGRRTMPLVVGQEATRRSIGIFVPIWCLACLIFWDLSAYGSSILLLLGGILAWNVMTRRTRKDDELSWRLWCFWMGIISLLPLFPVQPAVLVS